MHKSVHINKYIYYCAIKCWSVEEAAESLQEVNGWIIEKNPFSLLIRLWKRLRLLEQCWNSITVLMSSCWPVLRLTGGARFRIYQTHCRLLIKQVWQIYSAGFTLDFSRTTQQNHHKLPGEAGGGGGASHSGQHLIGRSVSH